MPRTDGRLLIMDSHPVQYRVPVYQALARLKPDAFEVIYATDCSVRGHRDPGFGVTVKWNTPMLEGYPFRVLNNERGEPLSRFRSLHARGVFPLLARSRPHAALFTQFAYEYDLGAYLACLRLGIPIWLRQETQDEALVRTPVKSFFRRRCYRLLYWPVRHAFYIGELNRRHLRRHGLRDERLSRAPYCVSNPVAALSPAQKLERRAATRARLGLREDELVVCFSGKFIPKKDPALLAQAAKLLEAEAALRLRLLFIGSGELESGLRRQAASLPRPAVFAGFINQSELPDYYLAADILVLPSRRLGETWGLVVNEALNAGCGVVLSRAVGCATEFGRLERCRIIAEGDVAACAAAIRELAKFPRSFDWAEGAMQSYSIESAARAIAAQLP